MTFGLRESRGVEETTKLEGVWEAAAAASECSLLLTFKFDCLKLMELAATSRPTSFCCCCAPPDPQPSSSPGYIEELGQESAER